MDLEILRKAIEEELNREVERLMPTVVAKMKERMAAMAMTIVERSNIEAFGPRCLRITLEFPEKKAEQ